MADTRMLESFGVSASAEVIYVRMLEHPDAGVAELANRPQCGSRTDSLDEVKSV